MTGLRWKQEALSCLPESFVIEQQVPKAMPPPRRTPNAAFRSRNEQQGTKGVVPQLSGPMTDSGMGGGYGYSQQTTVPTPPMLTTPVFVPPQVFVQQPQYGQYQQQAT